MVSLSLVSTHLLLFVQGPVAYFCTFVPAQLMPLRLFQPALHLTTKAALEATTPS
jgi:hypothetical protein